MVKWLAEQQAGPVLARVGVPEKALLVVAGRDGGPIGRMSDGKVVILADAGLIPAASLPGWTWPDPNKVVVKDRVAFAPVSQLVVGVDEGEWYVSDTPIAFAPGDDPEEALGNLREVARTFLEKAVVPAIERRLAAAEKAEAEQASRKAEEDAEDAEAAKYPGGLEYVRALRRQDWYSDFSDDARVSRNGDAGLAALRATVKAFTGEARAWALGAWLKHAPSGYTGPES